MKIKKFPFVLSFAIATVLVTGTAGFADSSSMMNMMNGEGMGKMMEAMNTPEGQEMIKACSSFMESTENNN
jgi:hypothetical protein